MRRNRPCFLIKKTQNHLDNACLSLCNYFIWKVASSQNRSMHRTICYVVLFSCSSVKKHPNSLTSPLPFSLLGVEKIKAQTSTWSERVSTISFLQYCKRCTIWYYYITENWLSKWKAEFALTIYLIFPKHRMKFVMLVFHSGSIK